MIEGKKSTWADSCQRGSIGFPNKNLALVDGTPVMHYTVREAKNLSILIDW